MPTSEDWNEACMSIVFVSWMQESEQVSVVRVHKKGTNNVSLELYGSNISWQTFEFKPGFTVLALLLFGLKCVVKVIPPLLDVPVANVGHFISFVSVLYRNTHSAIIYCLGITLRRYIL